MTGDERDDELLAEALARHHASCCPNCGRSLDRGDVSWNDASTSEGTPYTWAQIQCQNCDAEVARWYSWWPGCDYDFSVFVEHVLPDWK
jgi:hypothetical protein